MLSIKDLVYKDNTSDSESNDMYVLLRLQSLLTFVMLLVATLCQLSDTPVTLLIMNAMTLLMCVVIFVGTYNAGDTLLASVFCFWLLTYSYVLLVLTNVTEVQYITTALILIFFYNTKIVKKSLFICAFVLILILCAVSHIGKIVTPLIVFEGGVPIASTIFSIYLNISILISAYFYFRKFTSKETELIDYNNRLKDLSLRDPLTTLFNRRGIQDYIHQLSDSTPYSVAMGDIDFFKNINDVYGHACGDYVLVEVANHLTTCLGKGIKVSRWGGEEFLIVAPNVNGRDLMDNLVDVRMRLARKDMKYQGTDFYITMTFGVEEHNRLLSSEQTINSADAKLYRGKEGGRNTVIY